jgi:hypothetical protein
MPALLASLSAGPGRFGNLFLLALGCLCIFASPGAAFAPTSCLPLRSAGPLSLRTLRGSQAAGAWKAKRYSPLPKCKSLCMRKYAEQKFRGLWLTLWP